MLHKAARAKSSAAGPGENDWQIGVSVTVSVSVAAAITWVVKAKLPISTSPASFGTRRTAGMPLVDFSAFWICSGLFLVRQVVCPWGYRSRWSGYHAIGMRRCASVRLEREHECTSIEYVPRIGRNPGGASISDLVAPNCSGSELRLNSAHTDWSRPCRASVAVACGRRVQHKIENRLLPAWRRCVVRRVRHVFRAEQSLEHRRGFDRRTAWRELQPGYIDRHKSNSSRRPPTFAHGRKTTPMRETASDDQSCRRAPGRWKCRPGYR